MRKILILSIAFLSFPLSLGLAVESLACRVVSGSVHDGDTIRVTCGGEQKRIRFACVDAPEIDQLGGIVSRDHLLSILAWANNEVSINPVRVDRFGRVVAEVYAGGALVQLQQAQDGMVWAWYRFKSNCPAWDSINRAFNQARLDRRGIFAAGDPLAPWDWRRNN